MLQEENKQQEDFQVLLNSLYENDERFMRYQILRRTEVFVQMLEMLRDQYSVKELAKLACSSQISLMHLYASYNRPNEDLLDKIIHCYKQFNFNDDIFGLIWAFLQYISPSRSNYATVLKYLRDELYGEQVSRKSVQALIKLLEFFFSEKKQSEPNCTFLFNGPMSGLNVDCQGLQWPFARGFSFVCYVNIQDCFTASKLIMAQSGKQGFEISIKDCKVFFQSMEKADKQVILLDLPMNKWVLLNFMIEHKTAFLRDSYYLKVQFDNTLTDGQKVDFPQISKECKLTGLKLFENLLGQVSTIMLFTEPTLNLPYNLDQRFGIQNNVQIKQIMKDKNGQKLILCYTPLREGQNIAMDFVNRMDGQLTKQSSGLVKHTLLNFKQVCKLQNLLPLFQFGEKFTPIEYPDLLNDILQMLGVVLRVHQDSQTDAVECDFLSIVAHLINTYCLSFVNERSIHSFQELKNSFSEKQLKTKFVHDFLWQIDFQQFKTFELTEGYLKYVRACYNSLPELYTQAFGVRAILELAHSTAEPISLICCEQHALQMGIVDYKKSNNDVDIVPVQKRVRAFFTVIEAVLYYLYFDNTSNKQIAKQQLSDLLQAFAQRHSPCFYQELLSLLLRLYKYEHTSTLSKVLSQQLKSIAYVLTFCNCPDVKTSCIKLIAETVRITSYPAEYELAVWVGHTLGNTAAAEQHSELITNEKYPGKRYLVDQESLYVAVMEWALRRPASAEDSQEFLIDEGDLLGSAPALHLIGCLYGFASEAVKGRIIQDLCMLAKWNTVNCQLILQNQEFFLWLQNVLLDLCQRNLSGEKLSQYENWIWDASLRLMGSLLQKQGLESLAESLSVVCQNYNIPIVNARLVMRFVAKYILQSETISLKSDTQQYWKNLQNNIFMVWRLTVEDPYAPLQIQQNDLIQLQRFMRISSRLFIYDNLPWKGVFTSFIDLNMLIIVAQIGRNIAELYFKPLCIPLNDFQLCQKALLELLDYRNHQEHAHIVEILFNKTNYKIEEEPRFIQALFLPMYLAIEYLAYNEIDKRLEKLEQVLLSLDYLFRAFICAIENARERVFDESDEKFIENLICGHLQFLQTVRLGSEKNQQVNDLVREAVRKVFLYLLIVVEAENFMLQEKTCLSDMIVERFQTREIPNLQLFVVRILGTYFLLKDKNRYVFELKEIKTLKISPKSLWAKIESDDLQQVLFADQRIQQCLSQIMFHLSSDYQMVMRMNFKDGELKLGQEIKTSENTVKATRQKFEDELVDLAQQSFNLQEEARILRLDQKEAWLRNARYRWHKCWNSVRQFNEYWVHPEFRAQIDKGFDINDYDYETMDENRIFQWKVWKYQTKQKSRPLLKVKLIDNINYQLKQNSVQEELKQQRELKLFQKENQNKLVQQQNTFIGILKDIKNTVLQKQSNEELLINKVIWIKTLTVRFGQMKISQNRILFYFESISQKETHHSLIKYRVPDECRLVKEWSIEYLSDIVQRKYVGRKNSLELIFLDGNSLVFSFPERQQAQAVYERLIGQRKYCPSLKESLQLQQQDWNLLGDAKTLNKWFTYRMTTFEYVMKLNKVSGRSYKDLTQYPVMPWVLNNGEIGRYRDLTKSMGALGNSERTDVFRQRYEMVDHFNKVPQFHYGSHYSSPAITFHYLIRLRPFSDGARELQSGKFDLADRLFFNFSETYRNATEELSDVRELVPEFFYMPEVFVNVPKFDFGLQQTGQRVHNVELPDWCGGDPYKFICIHRVQFENDYVSQHINHWIDLIFGYKQRGEEAVKALNTFYYLTYEGAIDLDQIQSDKQRISYESQMVHFGQVPTQVFQQKHPKRPPRVLTYGITDEKPQLQVFRQSESIIGQFLRNRGVSGLFFVSPNKLLLTRRSGEVSAVKLTNAIKENGQLQFQIVWDRDYNINLRKQIGEGFIFDIIANFEELPQIVLKSGKFLAVGGVWDGRLLIYNLEDGMIAETYNEQNDTITAIGSDQKQRTLVTGSKSGQICIYSLLQWNQINQMKCIAIHYNHSQCVNDIFICLDLRAVATCSEDGSVNLYNMYNGKFLRSYNHPKHKPIHHVAIFCTPLYGIVFYCAEELRLYSYSINGQLQATFSIDICAPMLVLKDQSLMDNLLIATNDGKRIIQLSTPFFLLKNELKLATNENMAGIASISVSPDRKLLAFGTRQGEFGIVVDMRSQ